MAIGVFLNDEFNDEEIKGDPALLAVCP
jgi:hypothetical protein